MKVLAMDCSGPVGSVAVIEDRTVLFERRFDCPRGRGGEVFRALDDAVCGNPGIERVVVGTGPGSYNGLRVTAAAGEGLASAWNADRIGILSVLGLNGGDDFFAAGDARGGTFYLVRVTQGIPNGQIQIVNEKALLAALAIEPELPVLVPSPLGVVPEAQISYPDSVLLALAGAYLPPIPAILPYYAKPVHITAPRPKG